MRRTVGGAYVNAAATKGRARPLFATQSPPSVSPEGEGGGGGVGGRTWGPRLGAGDSRVGVPAVPRSTAPTPPPLPAACVPPPTRPPRKGASHVDTRSGGSGDGGGAEQTGAAAWGAGAKTDTNKKNRHAVSGSPGRAPRPLTPPPAVGPPCGGQYVGAGIGGGRKGCGRRAGAAPTTSRTAEAVWWLVAGGKAGRLPPPPPSPPASPRAPILLSLLWPGRRGRPRTRPARGHGGTLAAPPGTHRHATLPPPLGSP